MVVDVPLKERYQFLGCEGRFKMRINEAVYLAQLGLGRGD